jgi:acetyl esterase
MTSVMQDGDECWQQEIAGVARREVAAQGSRRPLAGHLYTPGQPGGGMIVFFPPGGFVRDEMAEGDIFLRFLAQRTGCIVLGSSYTLADEEPFPVAAEDAHAVLKWVVKQKAKLGWNGEHLMVAGIEAGGNLAAVAALMARDRGGPALAAQLLIMPMLDPGLTSCSMRKPAATAGAAQAADLCEAAYRDYLPRAVDRIHPYASPLQSSRMKGLPPTLILSADDDPLRDEAEQYGAKLAAAGIRAMVRRLPPIALDAPNARCSCARQEDALQEMTAFLAALNFTQSAPPLSSPAAMNDGQ